MWFIHMYVSALIGFVITLNMLALACPDLGVGRSPSGPTRVHGGQTSSTLVEPLHGLVGELLAV